MWLDYSRMHDDSSFSVTSQGSLPWLQSCTTTTIYTKRDTPILTLYLNKYAKSDSILIHHSTPNFGGYNFVDTTLQNYELKTDITTQLVAKRT